MLINSLIIGINDDAFKPISPVLFLKISPALAWTATESIHASIISIFWAMRADITPARTSPVPPLDNSGPPSAHSNKSSWLLEQTIVFLPFRITKAENLNWSSPLWFMYFVASIKHGYLQTHYLFHSAQNFWINSG